MLDLERCMEIRILKKQGKGIKEICRLTGHSRNTVRKYLRSEQPPRYQERSPRRSILDPYKTYVKERIEAAQPHRLPSTVLFREIRERGYPGGERTVRTYVSSLYPVKVEPVTRFETAPGAQLQVDWCVFRRGKERLSAFVATLGYSRYSYVEFVTTEQFEQLKQCHINAFEHFGGVPREILYDNMKTVVLERDTFGPGRHRFHPGLWDLGKDYGFTPRLCRPYRAQTKGKVERFNRYLRNSFYYPLAGALKQANLVLDVETANAEVLKWMRDVANVREHGTTEDRPVDRLADEKPTLQALPRSECESPAAIESPHARSWPVESLQRSPAEYDRLLGVGA